MHQHHTICMDIPVISELLHLILVFLHNTITLPVRSQPHLTYDQLWSWTRVCSIQVSTCGRRLLTTSMCRNNSLIGCVCLVNSNVGNTHPERRNSEWIHAENTHLELFTAVVSPTFRPSSHECHFKVKVKSFYFTTVEEKLRVCLSVEELVFI